ncbi:hypothetical protein [Streptomyces sp. NPDC050856]|uniref:hypothetical protein n=1 Tax=Streptomyces sp. NPDC050856 TaxID=3154939 RepID=UPI0033EEC103
MTTRIRTGPSLLTTAALLAGALIATAAPPAHTALAAQSTSVTAVATEDSTSGAAGEAEWYRTTSLGGPIRACYKASCDWYYRTSPGDELHWSHSAYNEYGNLWYYVDNTHTRGWIHCGNVTAGC